MRQYHPDGTPVKFHAPFARSQFAPPASPGAKSAPTCRHCGQPLTFVEMLATGNPMPCDPAQRYGDGRRHLVVRETIGERVVGRMVPRAPEGTLGLEPHWGTCPNRPAAPSAAVEDLRPAMPVRPALRLVSSPAVAVAPPSCLRCKSDADVFELSRTVRGRPMHACRRCRGPLWPSSQRRRFGARREPAPTT